MTLSGLVTAATCLTFKTPPCCQSLRRHSTDIIFLDLQNSIPLSLFWNFTEHCAQQRMATALSIRVHAHSTSGDKKNPGNQRFYWSRSPHRPPWIHLWLWIRHATFTWNHVFSPLTIVKFNLKLWNQSFQAQKLKSLGHSKRPLYSSIPANI